MDEEWRALKSHEIDAKFSLKKEQQRLGGVQLFVKNRQLTLSMEKEAVVLQLSITFRNNLAIIPMVGHSYPTCQHIGSVDADFYMSINATNSRAAQIQQMYDLVENMNLSFKQIPQGFRNISIENDFLALFGPKEFILKSISASTIPDQPGRSSIVMAFQQAGVTTKTSFDDPEDLKQEYLGSSNVMRRKVYDILQKHLQLQPKSKYDDSFAGYKFETINIARDGRNLILANAVDKARDYYNDWLETVHKRIFATWDPPTTLAGKKPVETILHKRTGLQSYASLMAYDASQQEYVPEWERLKKSVKDRADLSWSNSIRRWSEWYKLMGKSGTPNPGNDPRSKIDSIQLVTSEVTKEVDQQMETHKYLTNMRKLLDDIIADNLEDDAFKHLKKMRDEQLGLGKGSLAYPDFALQLTAGAVFDTGKNKINDATLLSYDPDFYLWYPAYDGALAPKATDSILDSRLWDIAKKHSQSVWDDAQANIGEFFEGKYIKSLMSSMDINNNRKGNSPLEILKERLKPTDGKMPKALYENVTFSNSSSSEKIVHTIVPDPTMAHTNWYPDQAQNIVGKEELSHTTESSKAWGGVDSKTRAEALAVFGGTDETKQISLPPVQKLGGKDVGPVASIYPYSQKAGGKPKEFTLDMAKACGELGLNQAQTVILIAHAASSSGWGRAAENWRLAGIKVTDSQVRAGVPYTVKQGWECVSPNTNGATSDGTGCPSGKFRKYGKGMKWRAFSSMKDGVQGMLTLLKSKHKPAYSKLMASDDGYFKALALTGWYTASPDAFHKDAMGRKQSIVKYLREGSAKRWTPPIGSSQEKKIEKLSGQSLGKDVSSTMTVPITEAIKDFEVDILSGQGQRLVRAYPTFKLYFIEDDSGERKRLAYDDFFSYNSVKSIRVIRSREIAADLCILELTNVSGTLSNRKFKQDQYVPGSGLGEASVESLSGKARDKYGEIVKETKSPMKANTASENPIASLLLQEGIQISLKLGYASDPDLLDLVFTGHITSVEFSETDDLIQVIAQSFATELVQDIKGLENPIEKSTPWWSFWGFKNNATTGRILEEMLAQPEVLHFGRWAPREAKTSNRDLLTDKWQFTPNPPDDNIFAPPPNQEIEKLADGEFFKNLKYVIFRTTIWDIFKEMELRHPNFIASPVPYKDKYGDRMTMFFGLPNKLYFARHPNSEEENIQNKLKEAQEEVAIRTRVALGGATTVMGTSVSLLDLAKLNPKTGDLIAKIEDIMVKPYKIARLNAAKRAGYIRPFRRYHLITSRHHIISNNIQTNSNEVANTVIINYKNAAAQEQLSKILSDDAAAAASNKTYICKVDNAIPTEDMRTQYGQFVNVTDENLAKRYALALLARNLKRAYKGDLIIIGNPRIKPYDIVYLHDEESEMTGPIEVRQVVHTFTQETGFVTEITPDMLVSVSDWALVGNNEAMGMITAGAARSIYGYTTGVELENPHSASTNALFGSIINSIVGNYCTEKIVYFSQGGHPCVINPLTHHGRPFTGGIPIRKIPTSVWKTIFGKWYSDSDNNFSAWWEDYKDSWASTLKKVSFQYSEGDLLRGFTGRSFEIE